MVRVVLVSVAGVPYERLAPRRISLSRKEAARGLFLSKARKRFRP